MVDITKQRVDQIQVKAFKIRKTTKYEDSLERFKDSQDNCYAQITKSKTNLQVGFWHCEKRITICY